MYKESWGLKRICPMCRSSYYDLGRKELECPECGKPIVVMNLAKPRRGRKPSNIAGNAIQASLVTENNKPKENIEESIDIENIDIEMEETNLEDDSVLIEEDSEIDPTVDAGIKPGEDKEEDL